MKTVSLFAMSQRSRFKVKSFATIFLASWMSNVIAEPGVEEWQTSGSLVMSYQVSDTNSIDDEFQSSADLIFSRQSETDGWLAHFEVASSAKSNSVSGKLPEANADAGSALDKDNDGRLQLSELYYQFSTKNNHAWVMGLVDVSSFFEQSRIASDESTQFLGASFVGNPTIEFPDYTLGVVYERPQTSGPTFRAAIASSNGIADNKTRSYSQLLSITDDNKGAFGVASASWKSEIWLLRTGLWINSAGHSNFAEDKDSINNFGAYLLVGFKQYAHAANFRLGLANEEVSQASQFVSAAYQFQHDDLTLGLGLARAYLSPKETNPILDDVTQYEFYIRRKITDRLFLTADFQIVGNSDFGMEDITRDKHIRIWGFRTSYIFD